MNALHSTVLPPRRRFLERSLTAAGAMSLGPMATPAAENDSPRRFALIGFSKTFQQYSPAQTAELVATVGWDGIECPVRAKGQIEPERSPDELPKYVEALRRQNCNTHLFATDITSITPPHAETVLRTMAKLGLKRLRVGF